MPHDLKRTEIGRGHLTWDRMEEKHYWYSSVGLIDARKLALIKLELPEQLVHKHGVLGCTRLLADGEKPEEVATGKDHMLGRGKLYDTRGGYIGLYPHPYPSQRLFCLDDEVLHELRGRYVSLWVEIDEEDSPDFRLNQANLETVSAMLSALGVKTQVSARQLYLVKRQPLWSDTHSFGGDPFDERLSVEDIKRAYYQARSVGLTPTQAEWMLYNHLQGVFVHQIQEAMSEVEDIVPAQDPVAPKLAQSG